ncbi:hypothetical protein EFP18_29300 (plasmid) [Burkholderia glumae]|nr:putative membrane protein [Burkholderia glumae LMG 2196 = ATCC 33617]KHJ62981.1 hypothetical protein NCPPB3923_10610 [Burkholderia glumae]PJO20123.1 hypothetical protein Y5A_026710 [Burkholderia glumae AU6208]PNK93180.1 hypothetical protein CEQ24_029895 [Burkholderia glumae]QGA41675.1 hypothetical protein GAS19_29785 [Burkholderia glumae]
MSQTYGSQVFGPAYDVVVPVIMAVAFIYFGLRARGMTPDERAKMPLIIGNWKACFLFAAIATLLAVVKCLGS